MHYTQTQTDIPPQDREWFIKENAVAKVNRLQGKIDQQRRNIKMLEKSTNDRRKEIDWLQLELR